MKKGSCGAKLRPFDTIKNKDPCQEGHIFVIETVSQYAAFCVSEKTGQRMSIALKRIYCDGKERRTGFSLVQDGDES